MASGLTDDWGELAIALEDVRAFACDEITRSELQFVEETIAFARRVVDRR
jgi:hypothetical protein